MALLFIFCIAPLRLLAREAYAHLHRTHHRLRLSTPPFILLPSPCATRSRASELDTLAEILGIHPLALSRVVPGPSISDERTCTSERTSSDRVITSEPQSGNFCRPISKAFRSTETVTIMLRGSSAAMGPRSLNVKHAASVRWRSSSTASRRERRRFESVPLARGFVR